MNAVVVAALCGAAVALVMPRSGSFRRWQAISGRWRHSEIRAVSAATVSPNASPRGLLGACAVLGLAVAVVVGGPVGLAGGAAVAVGAALTLRRLEPREVRRRADLMRVQAPVACDLLASVLASGADLVAACDAVASALDDPLAQQLAEVAARLRLAAQPVDALAPLRSSGSTEPIAIAAARAIESGAPLAESLRRVATDLRLVRRAHLLAKARVLGVRAVLPLGLCFLPSFVLLGVVPVVVSLIGQLLAVVG